MRHFCGLIVQVRGFLFRVEAFSGAIAAYGGNVYRQPPHYFQPEREPLLWGKGAEWDYVRAGECVHWCAGRENSAVDASHFTLS